MAEYRGDVLWGLDKKADLRFSHENPDVLALYKDFLKEPLSSKAHHLLHTDHEGWKMPNQK
jgi:NADH-quinone oxidoreductase subunit G